MFSYIITLTIGITWIWNGKCLRFCHLSLDHYLEPDCFCPTFSTWTLIDPQLNENKFLTTVLSDLVYCSFCRPYDCSCIIAHTLTYIQNCCPRDKNIRQLKPNTEWKLWVALCLKYLSIKKRAQYILNIDQLSTLRDSQKTKHPRFRKTSTQQSFQNFAGADLALSLWRSHAV